MIILIFNGVTSCADRIISGLDEIELMINIYNLEKANLGEDALHKLGKGFLLLEIIHQKAEEHKKTLTWVDEIEIYLAFQRQFHLMSSCKAFLETKDLMNAALCSQQQPNRLCMRAKYGYDAFVKSYVKKNPTAPFTNKPIDLSKLKKMRLHFLPRMERKRYDRLLFEAQGGFF